jgi:hypothetical protein
MKTICKALAKGAIATVAAGAMAVSSASPAFAEHRDRDGISAGDVIAGALVIGGIAVIASAASKNNRDYDSRDGDYRYDRAGYGSYDNNGGYGRYDRDEYRRGNARQAIEQCVRTAERQASRYSYGRADVTDVRDIRETRWGYEVRGRIAVNGSGRDWRHGDNDYGRGWGGDYRGWNSSMRGYDSGSFKCRFERGRIVDLDFSGIRGL